MPANFSPFFHAATGNTPYDYQRRLACGEPGRTACAGVAQISDPASAIREAPFPCASRLISIPTGLGKTATVFVRTFPLHSTSTPSNS